MIGSITVEKEFSTLLRVYVGEGLICPPDASDIAARDYDQAIMRAVDEAISKRLGVASRARFCVDVLDQGENEQGHYAEVLIEAPLLEMTRMVRAFQ